MKPKSPLLESLESRQLFAVVLPAFADKIGIASAVNPTPTFADEFDGTSLDASKWRVRSAPRHPITPTSAEWAVTSPDAVVVKNGEVSLVAHNDPVTGQFESGWIQTAPNGTSSNGLSGAGDFTQAFGYWEAKLKMTSVSGMWNAFWVHASQLPDVGNDPAKANHPEIYGTEMDVVEQSAVRIDAGSGDTVHTTTHANGYASYHVSTSAHTNVASLPSTGSSAGDYHIYGLLWTPTEASVYIDGTLAYKEQNPVLVSKVAQFAILSNEIGAPGSRMSWGDVPVGGYGSVDTSTSKLTADYVRVWSLNGITPTTPPVLPPSTITPVLTPKTKTVAKPKSTVLIPTVGTTPVSTDVLGTGGDPDRVARLVI